MRRAIPLLALLACGWTDCRRDDIEAIRTAPVTVDSCGETDRVWREGPIERETATGYAHGVGCDTIGGLSRAGYARAWCAELAKYRQRCRDAGLKTGGER